MSGEIGDCFRRLFENDDDAMRTAAQAALHYGQTLPNDQYVIPERSPIAQGIAEIHCIVRRGDVVIEIGPTLCMKGT